MKRIKLKERQLPSYTRKEECLNMLTHIAGGCLGVVALGLCLTRALRCPSAAALSGALIYGCAMIVLYTVSSIYHGLRPGLGKKVMQVLDHCTIYLLIAGTYTPIALCALLPAAPALGWGMLAFQWALAAVAMTLTAIDLRKYRIFSMVCYIGMGWAILPFLGTARRILGDTGFFCLLWGGIAYTVGAILYGIGSKRKWFHTVFHVFVVLGSLLQLLCVAFFVL